MNRRKGECFLEFMGLLFVWKEAVTDRQVLSSINQKLFYKIMIFWFFCRPTMIKYKIDNIRELFGPKVNLQMIYNNPVCRLEK